MDIWNNYECDEQIDIFSLLGEETKVKIEKPIRLIELFSGYGSQALAFEYLGIPFEHHFVCENDKYAMQSYNVLHCTDFKTTDIRQVHAPDLNIQTSDKFTYLMTYSFPCTDLSCSGQMKGMSKGSGTRSGLLWEVERLLVESKEQGLELPQILMMENVTQIHNQNFEYDFKLWKDKLSDLGYISFWQDLNAKDYGIPQNRERTIMFSFLESEYGPNIVYRFPKPFPLNKCYVHFAWDRYEDKDLVLPKLKQFAEVTKWNRRKIVVYVLVGDKERRVTEQDLERINTLRNFAYPYVMIYDKESLPKGHELKKLQRWVNNRFIWESNATFEDYLKGSKNDD